MSASGPIKHSLMGGKLHVYRRANSGQWQCSAYMAGKNHRVSTKTDLLKVPRSGESVTDAAHPHSTLKSSAIDIDNLYVRKDQCGS